MGYYNQITILYGYKIPEEDESKSPDKLEEIEFDDIESDDNNFRTRWKIPYDLDVVEVGDCRVNTWLGAIGICIIMTEEWLDEIDISTFDKSELDKRIEPYLELITKATGIDTSKVEPRIFICFSII